ncbi:hypothetical protein FPHYL_4670 [Fusarium phyllophilum]|uniref:Uncharacterized protein n=1 Tax=Fusarium phyllophilum TaxID=47803 RepID=A0A8H5JZ08_9HYPO|nr:hypothetical protein FPHYL_4670 [Fusarium phyllophilum]
MEYLTDRAVKLENKISIYRNHRKTMEDGMIREIEQIQMLVWGVQNGRCFEYMFSRLNILEESLNSVREAEAKLLSDLANVRAIIAELEWGLAQEAIQPLPSKTTMLVDPGDKGPKYPHLDSRYSQVEKTEQSRRSFSWVFITRFSADPESRRFRIRHSKANECPIHERCDHWRYLDPREWATPEENAVDLQLVCIHSEAIAPNKHLMEGMKRYDDEVQERGGPRYTDCPCYIFDALKPDFSIVEKLGFQVLTWDLVGARWEEVMEHCGRLVQQAL